jgi:hypothetical protein
LASAQAALLKNYINAAANYTSFSRLIFNNDYSNTTNRGPNKITLYDDGSSWYGGFGIHDDIIGYYSGGNHVWYKTTSQTASTEYMRLTSGGNVGIGTSSPATKLDVLGSVSIRGTAVLRSAADIFSGLSYDIYGNIRVLRSDSAQADGMYIGYAGSGGPLRFFSNSGTTEFVTMATSGNVGIGSTSPAAKLDVVGNIQTEGLLGKAYSASGGATIDTGITADTFTVLEVVGYANPNSGGSSAYKDPIHIFIYNGAGWNGSALTQYIYSNQLAPLAREVYTSGSSSSANVIDVVWLTGSTESDSCPAATASSYQVRLKVSNYNSTYGSYFNVRIIKRY